MTTTARDTVYRMLRMLGVSDPEETPSSAQAEFGLLALNAMVKGWKAQGVDVGHVADWTLDSITDLEIDPQHWTALCALLAIHLSPEYPNAPVPPATAQLAQNGWAGIQAAYFDSSLDAELQADTGFQRLSANRQRWGGW